MSKELFYAADFFSFFLNQLPIHCSGLLNAAPWIDATLSLAIKIISPPTVEETGPASHYTLLPLTVKIISPRTVEETGPASHYTLLPLTVKIISPCTVEETRPTESYTSLPLTVNIISPSTVSLIVNDSIVRRCL